MVICHRQDEEDVGELKIYSIQGQLAQRSLKEYNKEKRNGSL